MELKHVEHVSLVGCVSGLLSKVLVYCLKEINLLIINHFQIASVLYRWILDNILITNAS